MVISPKNRSVVNFRGDLIKEIVRMGHKVIVIGPNKDYLEEILALRVQFIEVPFSKDHTNLFEDLEFYNKLKNIIKKEEPDLVFSYTIKPVIYGSLAAYKMRVKNIFSMVTGLGRIYSSKSLKTKFLKTITGILYKSAFKGCEKVFFQNYDDLEQLVNLKYLPIEKAVQVNGSGVNLEKFTPIELPEQNVFLMMARLIKEKGVIEFAKAAKYVKKDYPNARFILLGGYDNSIGAITPEDLEPYILDESIEYPGEVEDVVPFIRASKVFVLPTYYREGLPRTILESMAMGRPIITTDWPGCRDAVKDGVNGFLVQPKDYMALAEKIKKMIENPDIVQEMGQKSLELCVEKYDVRKINKKMLETMKIKQVSK